MTRRALLAALAASVTLAASPAAGQPAGGGGTHAVERLPLAAEYAGHRYRVSVARPSVPAPPEGYPVLFMLDGNAVERAFGTFLAPAPDPDGMPPAIVTIGYETEQRFDVRARAYDYTPALTPGGEESDPLDATRRNGGADGFLAFIADEILPALARRLPIDERRLGLWGHSYGGLFVLHALSRAPHRFRCHIAASPSLWWRGGHFLSRLPEYRERLSGRRFSLLITRGSAEAAPRPEDPALAQIRQRIRQRERIRAGVPPDADRIVVMALRELPGAEVDYLELPGQAHGPAFTASLLPSLRWFTRCAAAARDTLSPN